MGVKMNAIKVYLCMGFLFSLGLISSVKAEVITPNHYVYLTLPSNQQTPYLDPNNTDLTDGVISSFGWGTGINYAEAYRYVGWFNTDPVITFNFDSIVSIDALTLWVDDADGRFGVRLPTQASMTMGGITVTRDIENPTGSVPIGITFDQLNLTGDSLTLNVVHHVRTTGTWTMMSEVQFASPVPAPATLWLWLLGMALIGILGLFRKTHAMQYALH